MNFDNVILGKNAIYSTNSDETGLNNNIIVCGSSGCGKTMSISEPLFLETKNSSLIATVTKRRIVDKYKKLFEERGYVVEDLNFINPKKSTIAYDPFHYIKSYSDIKFLAESIVLGNAKKSQSTADPYWDEAAASLLSAEIAYILMTKQNATFADVLDFHSSLTFYGTSDIIKCSLNDKFAKLEKTDPTCYAVSCWRSFSKLPIKTAGCVYGTLNATIDKIFTPEIKEMIRNSQKIDFKKFAKEKTVLFVSTSAVNPSLHTYVNMFYAQAFKSLFEYAESTPNGILPIPVKVLCDDFATGSRIQNFAEYISIFREKKISVTLLLQSESQLEQMYSQNDATTIINNCDTYLYLGGMDLKTGKSISQRLNVPLDEVLYMPIGQEYIFRRGQRPISTTRFNILENEMYQQITKKYENEIR